MAAAKPEPRNLTAVYQLDEHERIMVQVPLLRTYPDELAEAKALAVAGVLEILAESVRMAKAMEEHT